MSDQKKSFIDSFTNPSLLMAPKEKSKLIRNPQKWDEKQFTVLKKLGEGVYGQVFLVQENSNKKLRVFKKIYIKTNWKSEIEILSILSQNHCSPYIVCFTGNYFFDSKFVYIELEYLEGYRPLNTITFENSQEIYSNPQLRCNLVVKLIRGLHSIHVMKIAHQDLKGDNIMVKILNDHEVSVKYIDFGLSCFDDKWKCTADMDASREYKPPEVFLKSYTGGLIPAQKRDIWALGIIIWEFIMGNSIFLMNEWIVAMKKILAFWNDRVDPNIEQVQDAYFYQMFDYNTKYDYLLYKHAEVEYFLKQLSTDYLPRNMLLSLKQMLHREPLKRFLPNDGNVWMKDELVESLSLKSLTIDVNENPFK